MATTHLFPVRFFLSRIFNILRFLLFFPFMSSTTTCTPSFTSTPTSPFASAPFPTSATTSFPTRASSAISLFTGMLVLLFVPYGIFVVFSSLTLTYNVYYSLHIKSLAQEYQVFFKKYKKKTWFLLFFMSLNFKKYIKKIRQFAVCTSQDRGIVMTNQWSYSE